MQPDPHLARYARQVLFAPLGPAGQRRLRLANVTLVGCGALGSVLAETLVRAGLGYLRLIDRDYLEIENLHRQVLYDEHDVTQNLPKAEAAARKLRRINSAVEVEPLVADLGPQRAADLLGQPDLILDGTDNLETRYLVNDFAVRETIPWIYGACLGAEGRVLPVFPRQSACLRCLWPQPPAPGAIETCDTAGVIGPAVQIVASVQAVLAMRLLTGALAPSDAALHRLDAWHWHWSVRPALAQREADCPCCARGEYKFLQGAHSAGSVVLCGRDAVQVLAPAGQSVDLKQVAARLTPQHRPVLNAYLLRFQAGRCELTIFPDGRAIVKGTTDPGAARSLYARFVGT